MKKVLLICISVVVAVSIIVGIINNLNKGDNVNMTSINKIDASDLKIDHLVINVDKKYQENNSIINKLEDIGLPYAPKKGKGNSGFKVSNLWLGEEYFEMVHVKNEEGGGWLPDWVKRYNEGERGLICLFLDTEDIDSLYANLKEKGMSEPQKLSYKYLFDLITFSAPWKNAYLPYFNSVPLQIGFQQMDSQKIKDKMQKKMEPNSRNNGITGIKRIELYGNYTKEDEMLISSLFTTKKTANKLTWKLKNEQSISFIKSDTYKVKVYADSKQNPDQKSIQIENVEIIVE